MAAVAIPQTMLAATIVAVSDYNLTPSQTNLTLSGSVQRAA